MKLEMIKLDDLKPKEIKENNFTAWVELRDKKYLEFYKHIYLEIVKDDKDGIVFWEVHKFPQTSEMVSMTEPHTRAYKLSLDTVKWLVDKKKIKSKRIKLVLKLAGNENKTKE